jgi:hypothetical protein
MVVWPSARRVGNLMRNAWRHGVVYGKYVRSRAPGREIETISSGAVSSPRSSMRRTTQALVFLERSFQRRFGP